MTHPCLRARTVRAAFRSLVGLAAVGAVVLSGCGSDGTHGSPGTGNPGTGNPGNGTTGTVRGVVHAPNGTTPLAGVLVWVPQASGARQNGEGTPPEPYVVYTTTGADGSFQLNNVPSGNPTVKFLKGSFQWSAQVQLGAGQTVDLSNTATTVPTGDAAAAELAVVTGSFDRMQDVLAKLGFGELDSSGMLSPGTETFDLYDGDGSLPDSYPAMATLLQNASTLAQYDIVFINCGADESLLDEASVVQNLRTYVQNGGKLYCTDLAYDFVEQAFPAGLDFEGSDATPADQAEERDAAERGNSGIEVEATVLDDALRAALQAQGALDSEGHLPVEGFLAGWGVIESVPAGSKAWIEGPVSFFDVDARSHGGHRGHDHGTRQDTGQPTVVRPLTATFDVQSGRALYSSYHTEETPSAELRPQERVLAYLVFEL